MNNKVKLIGSLYGYTKGGMDGDILSGEGLAQTIRVGGGNASI